MFCRVWMFLFGKIKVEVCYHLSLWRSVVFFASFWTPLVYFLGYLSENLLLISYFQWAGDDVGASRLQGAHLSCSQPPVSLSVAAAATFQSGLDCLSSLATSPSSLGHRAFCFCHSLVVWLGSPGCPVQPVTTHQPHPVRRFWIMDKSG